MRLSVGIRLWNPTVHFWSFSLSSSDPYVVLRVFHGTMKKLPCAAGKLLLQETVTLQWVSVLLLEQGAFYYTLNVQCYGVRSTETLCVVCA